MDIIQSVNFMQTVIVFQCTTRICHYTRQLNLEAMETYSRKHEKGMIFKCYFHPTNVVTDGAVLNLTIHWSLAVHVILWPCLGMIIGIISCAYMYFRRRDQHKHRKKKQPAMVGNLNTIDTMPSNHGNTMDTMPRNKAPKYCRNNRNVYVLQR